MSTLRPNSCINETPCLAIHLRQDLFITLILFVIQLHREILSRYALQINGTRKYAYPNAAVDRMSDFGVLAQPIDATHALNLSAGVSNPSVLRGRSFN